MIVSTGGASRGEEAGKVDGVVDDGAVAREGGDEIGGKGEGANSGG